MDYGIIFIVIIIIIIIIAIILIIYANRTNSINILTTFPSYRIQQVDSTDNNNSYLGLKNTTVYNSVQNSNIKLSNIKFWSAYVCSGLSNDDPLGIWKIENIEQNNNIPITSGSQVYLVNYVYNLQSDDIGYLVTTLLNTGDIFFNFLTPSSNINKATVFTYNIIGNNLFTLQTKINNEIRSVIVDRTNNFLIIANNIKISPSVFKLDFQQQKQQ